MCAALRYWALAALVRSESSPFHAAGSLTTAPSWSIVRPGGGSAVSGGVSLAFSGMVTVVQPKRGALLTLQIRRERHTVVP